MVCVCTTANEKSPSLHGKVELLARQKLDALGSLFDSLRRKLSLCSLMSQGFNGLVGAAIKNFVLVLFSLSSLVPVLLITAALLHKSSCNS